MLALLHSSFRLGYVCMHVSASVSSACGSASDLISLVLIHANRYRPLMSPSRRPAHDGLSDSGACTGRNVTPTYRQHPRTTASTQMPPPPTMPPLSCPLHSRTKLRRRHSLSPMPLEQQRMLSWTAMKKRWTARLCRGADICHWGSEPSVVLACLPVFGQVLKCPNQKQ